MDDSKENIKMLLKATEIQKYWNPKFNDLFVIKAEFEYSGCTDLVYMHKRCNKMNKQGKIWIPFQYQLQDMITEFFIDDFTKERYEPIDCTRIFAYQIGRITAGEFNGSHYYKQFKSMEQLWLAFVMIEEHNKVWDSKKEKWKNG